MKLSIQTANLVSSFGFKKAYKMIKEAGFEAVDWNIDRAWNWSEVKNATELKDLCIFEKSQCEIMEYYSAELTEIKNNGLIITQCHAPFHAYDFGRDDILEYSIEIYKNIIKFLSKIGCPRVVIHGISVRNNFEGMTTKECNKLNMHLFTSLIPTLKGSGVTVCLENLFSSYDKSTRVFREGTCSDPDEAAKMVDKLNRIAGEKVFGFCLDTGHLNLLRKDVKRFIPTVGKRIIALHIHDNSQYGDNHIAPYTGTFQWADFLAEMKKIKYSGDLSFETCGQISPNRIPDEMVMPFLKLIAETGKYFKNAITK